MTLSPKPFNINADGLVFYCSFDDEASITAPGAGPSGVFKGGLFAAAGKLGPCLYVPRHTSCAKFALQEGTLGPAGTIEFWAKAEDGPFEDQGCPRFFEILAPKGAGEISQDWNSNNGSGGSGLTFRVDGLRAMATSNIMPYSSNYKSVGLPMSSTPSGWHHYALVWDVKGIESSKDSVAAVYFDGKLLVTTSATTGWEGPSHLFGESTLFFPSREDEMPWYAKRAYTIDEFKIWNFTKTEFEL